MIECLIVGNMAYDQAKELDKNYSKITELFAYLLNPLSPIGRYLLFIEDLCFIYFTVRMHE
jgi:hypothetical protein